MKKSIFVTERPQQNGDCVLFCSETASIIVLNSTAMKLWHNGDWDSLPESKKLSQMKFIVDDEEDQLAIQHQIRNFVKEPRSVKTMNFVIAPTLFCNARCSYCFERKTGKKKMNRNTETAMINFITSTMKKFNAQKIAITWFGGEPLLEKELIRRVSKSLIAAFGDDNYIASITTNGSLVDNKTIELFKECKITSIQITLDGTEDKYNHIKNYKNPKFNYQTVVKNIERCLSNNLFVTIRLNISKANYSDLQILLTELEEKFRDYKNRMHVYVFPIMGEKNDPLLYQFGSEELKHDLGELYKQLFNLGYKHSYKALGFKARPVHCSAFRYHSYSIDPNGDIFRCEHHLGQKEWSVGNVFTGVDNTLPKFKYWLNPVIPKKCETCKILPMCQGGCVIEEGTNLDTCSIQLLSLDTSLDLAYKLYERRRAK